MPLPNNNELRRPILQLLSDGNLWRKSQLIKPLAEKLGLNEAEINAEYPSGNGNIFADKISWVLSYHALTGLLLRPKRGFYQITDLGKQYADKDDIEVINFVKEKMAIKQKSITKSNLIQTREPNWNNLSTQSAKRFMTRF